jgi:hypothetical protein
MSNFSNTVLLEKLLDEIRLFTYVSEQSANDSSLRTFIRNLNGIIANHNIDFIHPAFVNDTFYMSD